MKTTKNRINFIKIIYLFIIVIFFAQCKDNDNIKNIKVKYAEKDNLKIKKDRINENNLEKTIYKYINLIQKSDKANRKELLIKLLSYENKVDGEIADEFYNFIFSYPLENTNDFFSILTMKDTIFINKWIKASVPEYYLIKDNLDDKEFEKKFKNDLEKNIISLDTTHKKVAKYFLNKFINTINSKNINSEYKVISKNTFLSDFLSDYDLSNSNMLDKYAKYDFSNIWLSKNSNSVLGTIGDNNQRIQIKFTEITKNPDNPLEYFVKGKSKVKNNICDFSGSIKLEKILENDPFYYDSDNNKNKGIVKQGLLIGNYNFLENKKQKGSGKFIGQVFSKWYIDYKNNIKYDDTEMISDAYTNNVFFGKWISYKTNKAKNCSWSDFRVPNGTPDLDIGAAEFSPNKKYFDKGWKNYYKKENKDW